MTSDFKRYVAELFGTFVLVFVGCGTAVFAGSHVGYFGVAVAFGLGLLTMCYAIGPISCNCHVMPRLPWACGPAGDSKPSTYWDT